MGTEQEPTVPIFNIWTLWWTADRVAHGFTHYWDAPFFYPNPGVFTYSEPQPLTGLLVAPLWALGASPAFVYNVALLVLLILNGVFAYRLVRSLDVPPLPALLSSILTITLPFVAKELGVLLLLPVFGMLWTLDGLVRFGHSGAIRHTIWAAAGFIALSLTCEQYALMFAPFVLAAGLVALTQRRFQVGAMVCLAVAGSGALLVALLVAMPALTLHAKLGFVRSEWLVQQLSARFGDFLTRPNDAWIGFQRAGWDDTAGLFPGIVLLALASAGAIVGWLTAAPPSRRWIAYFVGTAIAATLLAQGLNLSLGGWQPFEVLRMSVPGFSELRNVFRFAIIMQMVLPVLAAIALLHIRQRLARMGRIVVVSLALLAACENLAIPAPLTHVPLSPRMAWTSWLHAQPEGTVVAHVPFAPGLGVADYEIDTWRLFAQIDHHKPIANGYSGFFPPGYSSFQMDVVAHFPRRDLLCELNRGLGVNTLVVDRSWLVNHRSQMNAYTGFLRRVYADNRMQIYHLHASSKACTST